MASPDPSHEIPAVAVSMPAFNAARFVLDAVHSVLRQTGVSLRLFVVDDGSTDETARRVADIDDPRLVLLSNARRRGIGASHNRVLAASEAPLIAQVDADDIIVPGALRTMVDAMEGRDEVAQAYCDFFTMDASGNRNAGEERRWRAFFQLHRRPPIDYRRELIEHGMVVSALRTYRRSALLEAGGFDEDLDWAVDYEMALRLAERHTFLHVPEMLYGRRLHPEGASQRVSRRRFAQWRRRRLLVRRQRRRQGGHVLGVGWLRAELLLLSGLGGAIRDELRRRRRPTG